MIRLQENNSQVNLTKKMLKGDDGGYYLPEVDAEGNLSFTGSEEDMPEVPGANIRGPQGVQGPAGKNSVYIGDEEPTEEYDVWIAPSGTASNVLTEQHMIDYVDAEIEKIELTPGPQGEKGDAGEPGPQGEQGNHIPTLVFGLDDAENIYRAVSGEPLGTLITE